jgi:hypothetical protein
MTVVLSIGIEGYMSLDKAMKNLKFDSRLTEYNLNAGILEKAELKAHLDKLPDLAANAESIDIEKKEKPEQH